MSDTPTFIHNHRGPFLFNVSRPAKKAGFFTSEWLKGNVEPEDIPAEAHALLTDPRDTINYVAVWSEREACFIGGYAKRMVETVVEVKGDSHA